MLNSSTEVFCSCPIVTEHLSASNTGIVGGKWLFLCLAVREVKNIFPHLHKKSCKSSADLENTWNFALIKGEDPD